LQNGYTSGRLSAPLMDREQRNDPIAPTDDVQWHEVQFYAGDEALISRVAAFAGSAIGGGGACIVCATPIHRAGLIDRLESRGIDVRRIVAEGRFLLLDADETLKSLLVNDWPDGDRFNRLVDEMLLPLKEANLPISVFGEMVALLWEQQKSEAALRLEQLWNQISDRHAISLLCAYSMDSFRNQQDDSIISRICAEHTHITPPELDSVDGSFKLQTLKELQNKAKTLEIVLKEREHLAGALCEEVEELRKMHELSIRVSSLEPLQIMREVLSAVAGFHHTNLAAFSICDTAANSMEVVASLGFTDAFFRYMEDAPAKGRPCRACMDTRAPVVMEDTDADPAFERHLGASRAAGFRAAHCTPLLNRRGELLAILSVYFREPRTISTRERRLTDLYAQMAANAIENSQQLLATQSELIRRKTAEDALTKSEEFSRSILESSADSISVLDAQGRLIYVSATGVKALGASDVHTILHRPWSSFWSADTQPQASKAMADAFAGRVSHFEGALEVHDESTWWDVNLAPMFNKKGEIEALTVVAREVTAIRLAHTALMQSEKLAAAGRLAATVAHEINNPLEAVTNFLYLVKTTEGLPDHVYSFLESADQELARVGHIARQTLGFYRDSSAPETVNINNLINEIVSVYERKVHSKQIELTRHIDEELSFFVRKGDLKQVLSNLLANAIDATPNRGRILLRAHLSMNWQSGNSGLRILVADNGSGMSPETRAKAFTAFFTTKAEVGTGIGLWVTRNILMNQGGSIRCHSTVCAHSGAVMNVFLPTL